MHSVVRGILLVLLLITTDPSAHAQSTIDSLQARLAEVDGRARVDVLTALAEAYADSDPEQGLRTSTEALDAATRLHYARGRADALAALGRNHYQLDAFGNAIAPYEQAADLYEALGARHQLGLTYNRLGNTYQKVTRYPETVEAFERAIAIHEEEDNLFDAAFSHTNLGLHFWRTGAYDRALPHYERTLEIWEDRQDERRMASTLNNIGVIYYQWARYDDALAAYQRSLALREKLGFTEGVAFVLNNIGLAYQDWGQLDRARAFYLDAYERARTIDAPEVQGYTLHNLGSVHEREGRYDEALAYYERANEAYEASDHTGGLIMNLINVGRAHHLKGDSRQALQILHTAATRARASSVREQEARALKELGLVYRDLSSYREAMNYLEQSLAVGHLLGKQRLIEEVYLHLSEVHAAAGNYEQALEAHQRHAALRDTLFNERSHRLLADVQAKYEAEKKEKENVLLRQAKARQEGMLVLVSLILGLALVSALLLFRANRQKREANKLLEASNAELARERDEHKELLHILSHDLANPLGNVCNCLELILEDPELLDEFGPLAHKVASNGIDLIDLVRRMRALEEGKLPLEPVRLREAVDEAALLLRDRFTRKRIALENEIDPALAVVAERTSLINSVVANILTNAVKFSHPGSTITAEAAYVGDDEAVRLMLRDRGIGMPEEVREHLFDLSRTTSRRGTDGEYGNGFGMSLVQKFVLLYGGRIDVASREIDASPDDHGTEVSITLAAAPAKGEVRSAKYERLPGQPKDEGRSAKYERLPDQPVSPELNVLPS